jgi:uncharacterized protein
MAFLFGGPLKIRLVVLAIFVTLTIFYLNQQRPLAFDGDVLTGSSEKPLTSPEGSDDDLRLADETPTKLSKPTGKHGSDGSADSYDRPISERPVPTEVTYDSGAPLAQEVIGSSTKIVDIPTPTCVSFEHLQRQKPGPASEGKRKFPYVRPPPECRTFNLPSMETLIKRMKGVIKDPDLFRLFENSYPNTLDTMIKWRGYAVNKDKTTGKTVETDEELTYVITGDIDAMWLRDSASQIYSYLPLLEASDDPDSLASLWRGLINSHSRYIVISPYCHSFQPPPESGIPPTHNGAYSQNHPMPSYDPTKVFDCKWELDSLASFLQVSSAYYQRTGDLEFFGKHQWIEAVDAAVTAAAAMRLGTYSKEGKVEASAWTFTGWTNRGSETLTNDGLGNPSRENGMVRTAFRPSDDACIYQFLVPANMMFAKYLEEASFIMERLASSHAKAKEVTTAMRDLALGIRAGIDADAVVPHRDFGDIFAYEVDGFGGANLMDDANMPSLLGMPLFNYSGSRVKLPPPPAKGGERDHAAIYQATRKFVLSDANPYYAKGPILSAVGGPHLGPGKGWPMAAVIAAMTAYEDISGEEDVEGFVEGQLRQVLDSTAGTGVIHETVNAWNEQDWTRSWFGWANGMFGELILRIEENERGKTGKGLLGRSWQD